MEQYLFDINILLDDFFENNGFDREVVEEQLFVHVWNYLQTEIE